jgi:hypothetical protein
LPIAASEEDIAKSLPIGILNGVPPKRSYPEAGFREESDVVMDGLSATLTLDYFRVARHPGVSCQFPHANGLEWACEGREYSPHGQLGVKLGTGSDKTFFFLYPRFFLCVGLFGTGGTGARAAELEPNTVCASCGRTDTRGFVSRSLSRNTFDKVIESPCA